MTSASACAARVQVSSHRILVEQRAAQRYCRATAFLRRCHGGAGPMCIYNGSINMDQCAYIVCICLYSLYSLYIDKYKYGIIL